MQSGQEKPPAFFNNPFQPSQNASHFPLQDLDASERYDEPLTLGGNRQNNVQHPMPRTPEEIVLDFVPTTTDHTTNGRNYITDREPATTTATILDVTDPNVRLQQEDPVTDQNIVEGIIKSILVEVVKWNIFNVLLFVLVSVTLKWNFSYLYIMVLLWISNVYNIIMISRARAAGARKDRAIKAFEIFNNLLSAIFKAIIVVEVETNKLYLSISLVPVLLSELSLSLAKCYKNRKNSASFFYKIEAIFKLFVVAQAIIFALKIEKVINWNWREVLCVYWILFAIMIGVAFAFLIMLIGKCCTYLFAEMEVYEVRGVIWLFAVVGGKTMLSYTLVRRTLNVLDRQADAATLIGVLTTIAAYSLGVAVYTSFYFKGIEELWRKVGAVGVTFTEEEDNLEGDKEETEQKKEPEKIDIPKFLTRFSGTYFRRATPDEIQKAKDTNKKKKDGDTKDNKDKAKANAAKNAKSRRRQNSFDQSKSRITYSNNTTHLNLLTVPETDGERTKTTIEWHNTSRFGLRQDKGKDFFANFTDRSGVSGIIPSSSMINSRTDRDQMDARDFAPASNDSYLLPPISKDSEIPTKIVRAKKEKPIPGIPVNEDISPSELRGGIMEESFEGAGDIHPHPLRRVQSMQDISPTQVISLSEALESPKVKNSVRQDLPEPLMSPHSEGSKDPQCLVCFDNPPDAVFMECGHGGVCYECSLEIWKATNECYLCRNKINQVLQVDLKTKLANNVIKVLSSTQMVLYDEDAE